MKSDEGRGKMNGDNDDQGKGREEGKGREDRERVERTEDWQIWIEPSGQREGEGFGILPQGRHAEDRALLQSCCPCILLLLLLPFPFRLFTKRYSKREWGKKNGEWRMERERKSNVKSRRKDGRERGRGKCS